MDIVPPLLLPLSIGAVEELQPVVLSILSSNILVLALIVVPSTLGIPPNKMVSPDS